MTDEGAYLNRCIPAGAPKAGPQVKGGAAKRQGDFVPQTLSRRFLPMRVYAPPCNRANVKKIPLRGGAISAAEGVQRIKRISPPSYCKRGGHVVPQEVSSFILS